MMITALCCSCMRFIIVGIFYGRWFSKDRCRYRQIVNCYYDFLLRDFLYKSESRNAFISTAISSSVSFVMFSPICLASNANFARSVLHASVRVAKIPVYTQIHTEKRTLCVPPHCARITVDLQGFEGSIYKFTYNPGTLDEIRTHDLPLRRRVLYPLSYEGLCNYRRLVRF